MDQAATLNPLLPLASLAAKGVHRRAKDDARSPAELIDAISSLRITHENREQQFQQEIQTIQQRQGVELASLKSDLRNGHEMLEKLQLECDILSQRVRQLEGTEGQTHLAHRPSALPLGLSSSHANTFVQTVWGIHYEAFGLFNPAHQERARPVRMSALQKDRLLLNDDAMSLSEREPRRSSKRQKPVKIAPASEDNLPLEEGGGTATTVRRIRVKPILEPKEEILDDEGSIDYPYSAAGSNGAGQSSSKGKRPRSPASSAQGPAKSAKKKNTGSTAARNKINIQMIPRAVDGSPLLPMQVGMFTLKNLGHIATPDDLCTQKTIYPIGYQCERRWFSTIDPKTLVTYLCSIEAGSDPQHPVFVVTPDDAPRETGHSATSAWWNIYKEGLRVRNQPEQAVMNGDEMFGLWDNVIKALLQELPGADKLSPYIWRTFIEGGPTAKRRNTANAVYHIESPVRANEESQASSAYADAPLVTSSAA